MAYANSCTLAASNAQDGTGKQHMTYTAPRLEFSETPLKVDKIQDQPSVELLPQPLVNWLVRVLPRISDGNVQTDGKEIHDNP
jgi:hypothetical protein